MLKDISSKMAILFSELTFAEGEVETREYLKKEMRETKAGAAERWRL